MRINELPQSVYQEEVLYSNGPTTKTKAKQTAAIY
jgi:hypothetical protein